MLPTSVYGEEMAVRARGMRAGGSTLDQIAAALGIGRTTAWRWCNARVEEEDVERPGLMRLLTAEPLWYLKGISYSAYRQSQHWRLRRQRFIDSLDEDDRQRCSRCGLSTIGENFYRRTRFETPDGLECGYNHPEAQVQESIEQEPRFAQFEVHHLTYERLGEELDEDLALLCNPCHHTEHYPDSPSGVWWREYLRTHPVPGGSPLPASMLRDPDEPEISGVEG